MIKSWIYSFEKTIYKDLKNSERFLNAVVMKVP